MIFWSKRVQLKDTGQDSCELLNICSIVHCCVSFAVKENMRHSCSLDFHLALFSTITAVLSLHDVYIAYLYAPAFIATDCKSAVLHVYFGLWLLVKALEIKFIAVA